ncbi:hypothetical protein AHF37_04311 [Paragonimus kellicotti]|nr:hypothetical protein AHF37_04311 [Paragonimus kellicotti]
MARHKGARSFVFVEPKPVAEEIVEETEDDVEIMKPQLGARPGKRISRKRLAEEPFVVRPVFDVQTVCVSAEALLAESSIPEHKMSCTPNRS